MTAINWIFMVLLLPIFVAAFKAEIGKYYRDKKVFDSRHFDDDDNPKTGQYGWICPVETGVWIKVLVKDYLFGKRPSKRKVITEETIVNEAGQEIVVTVVYSYDEWSAVKRGKE